MQSFGMEWIGMDERPYMPVLPMDHFLWISIFEVLRVVFSKLSLCTLQCTTGYDVRCGSLLPHTVIPLVSGPALHVRQNTTGLHS